MSAHGVMRAAGVEFGTDARMTLAERAEARRRIIAGIARRPRMEVPEPATQPTPGTKKRKKAPRRHAPQPADLRALTEALALNPAGPIEPGSDPPGGASDTYLRSFQAAATAELRELGAAVDQLLALLAEADDDVRTLIGDQRADLSAEVRRFLTIRHQRYPGVQQDIREALDRMALLSGWWPDDTDDGG